MLGIATSSNKLKRATPARVEGAARGRSFPRPHQVRGGMGYGRQPRHPLRPQGPHQGAAGVPRHRSYHRIVDVGLHALAIDEPRGPFQPTLWTVKKGSRAAAGPDRRAGLVPRLPRQRRRRLQGLRAFRHRAAVDGRASHAARRASPSTSSICARPPSPIRWASRCRRPRTASTG